MVPVAPPVVWARASAQAEGSPERQLVLAASMQEQEQRQAPALVAAWLLVQAKELHQWAWILELELVQA